MRSHRPLNSTGHLILATGLLFLLLRPHACWTLTSTMDGAYTSRDTLSHGHETPTHSSKLRAILESRMKNQWLRIEVSGGDRLEGHWSFTGQRDFSLLNHADQSQVRLDEVIAVWQRGVSRPKAMALGAVIGGAYGIVVSLLVTPRQVTIVGGHSSSPTAEEYLSHALGGFAVGAAAGALVGGIVSPHMWKQLYP